MNLIHGPGSATTPSGECASSLREEVEFALELILSLFSGTDHIADDWENIEEVLDLYTLGLDEIVTAATKHGANGLQRLCRRMAEQLLELRGRECDLSVDERGLLAQWPPLLLTYLASPGEPSASGMLVRYLQDHRWPTPLPADEVAGFVGLLQQQAGTELLLQSEDAGSVGQRKAPPEQDIVVADDEARGNETTLTTDLLLADTGDFPALFEFLQGRSARPQGEDSTRNDEPALDESKIESNLSVSNLSDTDALSVSHFDNAPVEKVADILALAEQEGLLGLQEVCLRLQQNISQCERRDGHLGAEVLATLIRFPALAHAYIDSPQAPNVSADLIEYLGAELWPEELRTDEAEGLQFILEADGRKDSSAPDNVQKTATLLQESVSPETFAIVDESIVAETQTVDVELVALLTNELASVQGDLHESLVEGGSPDASMARKKQVVENYAEQLVRLGMAAETIGFSALKAFLNSLRGRVLATADTGLTPRQSEILALFPGSLLAYLAEPADPSTCEGLIDLLRGDTWTQSLETAYATTLSRALSLVEVTAEAAEAGLRQTEAQPGDVSLELPDDLNQELLDGLLQEIPVHTGEFSAAIQRLATGSGTQEDVDVAKRAAHTLKGAATTVGIQGIANLTHHVEDILVALSRYEALPNRALAEVLTNAGDCLEAMGEAVMGTGPEPDYALVSLQKVLDWANYIDHEGIPEDTSPVEHRQGTAVEQPPIQNTDAPPASPSTRQNEAMVRVPASLIDELLRLTGETIISNGQVRERLRRLIQQNKTIQQQSRVFLQLATDLEELVDLRSDAEDIGIARKEDEFDPLEFEHYSELHTVSRQLVEAATDSGELSGEVENELADLGELVDVQNRLHVQSQNTVMCTRMVPVSTVASRLQRSVRQAARLLDKRATLNLVGADTMVDSNILNELVDPLMHILRNAVDHGIEAPEQRAVAGKAQEGSIELAFLREGNQVVVRCRDDGAGLDLAAVRRTAEQKGLLAAGDIQSDDELARLILAPGFSTRTESTQVSGRGIGMDVVHSRVLQLKGGVSLHGAPGKGLEIELRLPATLISTHALLVRSREQIFAISSYGIQDIHYVMPEQLQKIGGESVFRLGGEHYALSELDSLLNLPGERHDESKSGFPVLLVRLETGVVQAMRVQEIIDSSELVVKNLGRYIPKLQGVVGATILGDGSVAAVVDLPELMRKPVRLPQGRANPGDEKSAGSDSVQSAPSRFAALIVDDSLSARRATAQFMKDAGFEVRTAIDGLEAVSILDKWKPDILLVDMEMPRMNGLELTAHVRARTGMAELPVIMITSRSTEKHRRQAEAAGVNVYLTKPFGENQLLQYVTHLTAA